MPHRRRGLMTVACCAALAGSTLTGVPASHAAVPGASSNLGVKVVSGRPGMVTGGDTLVEVTGRGSTGSVATTVDGARADATVRRQEGHTFVLVRGLRKGRRRISVTAGGRHASVTVVNHPISGPVFSGPHRFLMCSTQSLGLGPATGADCSVPTEVVWKYRTSDGRFVDLPDGTKPDALPADVVRTKRGMPFVVRYETGVINRSPYFFAVVDPTVGTGAPTWNDRLVYEFGGGCGTSYSQGSELGTNVLDADLLTAGYAVATATFNTFQTSCDDVLSAETTMMVKEHVIETIGPPRFTIGAGASGGAIQQLLVAQNYPGLLDALSPVIPFPDAISVAPGVADCGLLTRFYASDAAKAWTDAQKRAVNGQVSLGTCALWVSSFLGNIDADSGCDPRIPKSEIYDARANPKGIRCTLQDYGKALFGVDPKTGFARRPLDNVGVQYGLRAVQRGVITVDQFLDLNEHIGGYDIDGNPVEKREAARAADMRRAYETGRVLSGGGGIKKLPIITVNLYSDREGDIHDRFRLFTIRDRLKTNGKVDRNETIWTRPSGGDLVQAITGNAFKAADVVTVLDRWLTTGKRPAAAVDNCLDRNGKRIAGDDVYDKGVCKRLYPIAGDARVAAGAPIVNDILKCRLERIDPKAYGKAHLSREQLARLRRIFPGGVCNWKAKGVGQVPLAATWIDYGAGRFEAPGT